jgi:hypothetical protein
MRTILSAIVLASFANSTHAGFFSGNDLYQYCSTRRATIEGFVAGVFDASENDNQALNDYLLENFVIITNLDQSATNTIALGKAQNRIKSYCEPKGITLGQVSDVYCQFLAAKPAMRHMSAAYLFRQSLTEAWPCPWLK